MPRKHRLDPETERAVRDFASRIAAQYDLAFDVMLETGIRISPLPIWLDQWEQPSLFSNPAFVKTIARERVEVRALLPERSTTSLRARRAAIG